MKKLLLFALLSLCFACKDDAPKNEIVVVESLKPYFLYFQTEGGKRNVDIKNDTNMKLVASTTTGDDSSVSGHNVNVDTDFFATLSGPGKSIYISKLLAKVYYPTNTCVQKYEVTSQTNSTDDIWLDTLNNLFLGSNCPL